MTRVQSGDSSSGTPRLPQQGFLAPEFTLTSLNGDIVSLESFRGRPVLINLWATWCPPCEAEMPALQEVYEAHKNEGFAILAVNATNQDDPQRVNDFVQEYGLTFPILLDTDGSVSQQYQLRALPTSFFIDENGMITEVVVGGPMAEALIEIRVQQLLGKTP